MYSTKISGCNSRDGTDRCVTTLAVLAEGVFRPQTPGIGGARRVVMARRIRPFIDPRRLAPLPKVKK